ncbi:NHLP leader peptide family natural product precursor [Paenibacillus sp. SYP-B3998]|uniref:NHLP leader peptide family natural product n=1 Tax=Paenibacillus sp. SYP-B3998 TaxID=2678564 RepID=A0A6G4A1N8_9BACL|nr:NHLP leader peptide family RiPP precursor [Paenibacillus sp. SYP-B3998]NEW07854.1 NHLP leader peptide family natural product precursor [Paenibacillus sp. SYP-B3998]
MSAEELKAKIIQKAWEDASFKAQLLSDPKAALKEAFGIVIPDNIEIKTVEETPNQNVLVIPVNPAEALNGTAPLKDMW